MRKKKSLLEEYIQAQKWMQENYAKVISDKCRNVIRKTSDGKVKRVRKRGKPLPKVHIHFDRGK